MNGGFGFAQPPFGIRNKTNFPHPTHKADEVYSSTVIRIYFFHFAFTGNEASKAKNARQRKRGFLRLEGKSFSQARHLCSYGQI